jgi:hypothetical protein
VVRGELGAKVEGDIVEGGVRERESLCNRRQRESARGRREKRGKGKKTHVGVHDLRFNILPSLLLNTLLRERDHVLVIISQDNLDFPHR